jgi:hypothetical protein
MRALRLCVVASLALAASHARAEPYRLRADAVGYTQSPQSPVGLVVLQGEDQARPWVDTEALVWAGNGANGGDALVMLVRVHDPRNWGELRLGRQFITAGAVRPVHLDGADARARLPTGTSVEVFGGAPVAPQFGYHPYDWASGARVGQSIGRDTTTGVSYLQRREGGRLAFEEAGWDFASSPARWFDVATRAAYDIVNPGLTEASASLAGRFGDVRPELYAMHRSPSRLLPATSLFSALGDTPSDVIGAAVPWRMFPRLDLLPMAGARIVDGDVGLDATLRTTLRLDDLGAGALMLELRRQDAAPERWTGVRAAARIPITPRLRWSTELELVMPDDPRGRGTVWPWALVAMRYVPWNRWEIAGAVESASTPRNAFELNALVRLSRSWGGP